MQLIKLAPGKLDELIDQKKPVYVINTSVLPDGNKGMIVVNFFDGTRREFFKIPPTFIPISATDSIPASRLRESRDFKQCLVKGMLTLIEPTSAENYLSTREAQEEYESLMLSEHSAQSQGVAYNAGTRASVAVNDVEGTGPMQDVSAVDTVSNKVRGLVEALKSGTKSAKEVKVDLRRHAEALSPVDIAYVQANATDPELLEFITTLDQQPVKPSVVDKPTAKKTSRRKATKAQPKVSQDYKAFDLDDKGEANMSPEELRADAEARSKAMAEQSLNGQSRVNDEINKLIGG